MDLRLSISNDIVSSKIYDKRADFDFEIVVFPFLGGDVPHSASYGDYSTANIKALRGSLGALSVNKLSHIPKLQPISAVYEKQ